MNILQLLDSIENIDYHLARLLILLNIFSRDKLKPVNGITKLVKLDFLLRYPKYLEKALNKKNKDTQKIQLKNYEQNSVESKMIRYKYGPWDPSFRLYLNILLSKSLINIELRKKTIYIGISKKGIDISEQFLNKDEFKIFSERSKILRTNFDIGGTSLKNFIYETFPEITNLTLGEEIR